MESRALKRRKLRADIILIIDRHVNIFPDTGGSDDWEAYDRFKQQLSRACGYDAETGSYDQPMYDSAIHAYLAIVGL